ncbi:MAG: hypothetical protein AVDCRST_MAG53-1884, partial [uncultured Solirubrobacteraceae bacterium]
ARHRPPGDRARAPDRPGAAGVRRGLGAQRRRGARGRPSQDDGPDRRAPRGLGGRRAAVRGDRRRADGLGVLRRRPRQRRRRLRRTGRNGRRHGRGRRADRSRGVRRHPGAAALTAGYGRLDGPAAGRGAGPPRRSGRRAHPARRQDRDRHLEDRHRRLGEAGRGAGRRAAGRRRRRLPGRQRGLPDADRRQGRRVLPARVDRGVRHPGARGHRRVPPRRRQADLLADASRAARAGSGGHHPCGQRRDPRGGCRLRGPGAGRRRGRALHPGVRLPRRAGGRRAGAAGSRPRRHPPQRARRRAAGRPPARAAAARLRAPL